MAEEAEQGTLGSPRQSKIHCHLKEMNLRGLVKDKAARNRERLKEPEEENHFLWPSKA